MYLHILQHQLANHQVWTKWWARVWWRQTVCSRVFLMFHQRMMHSVEIGFSVIIYLCQTLMQEIQITSLWCSMQCWCCSCVARINFYEWKWKNIANRQNTNSNIPVTIRLSCHDNSMIWLKFHKICSLYDFEMIHNMTRRWELYYDRC